MGEGWVVGCAAGGEPCKSASDTGTPAMHFCRTGCCLMSSAFLVVMSGKSTSKYVVGVAAFPSRYARKKAVSMPAPRETTWHGPVRLEIATNRRKIRSTAAMRAK